MPSEPAAGSIARLLGLIQKVVTDVTPVTVISKGAASLETWTYLGAKIIKAIASGADPIATL